MKPIVIDNIISQKELFYMYSEIVSSPGWNLVGQSTVEDNTQLMAAPLLKVKDSNLTNWNRPGLLQCWTFENDHWNVCDGVQWAEDILKFLPFEYELQRVKINFNPKVNISEDECMHPHCDMEEGKNSYTAIYYMNDSDGDTVIFNETKMDTFLNGEELSIKKRIKSKKGRFVMFKQDYLHAGFPPTKSDYRVVINFNFRML